MNLFRRCLAELLGTFVLLACGCGAVVNEVTASGTPVPAPSRSRLVTEDAP